MKIQLIEIANKLLSKDEYVQLMNLGTQSDNIYRDLLALDRMMGGIGIYNINEGDTVSCSWKEKI